VMVQGLLERLLHAEKIDAWFKDISQVQYTKKNTFFFTYFDYAKCGLSSSPVKVT